LQNHVTYWEIIVQSLLNGHNLHQTGQPSRLIPHFSLHCGNEFAIMANMLTLTYSSDSVITMAYRANSDKQISNNPDKLPGTGSLVQINLQK